MDQIMKEMQNLQFPEFLNLLESLANDEEATKEAIIAKCATDVELFAKIFFPHYCTYPFNQFHHDTFADYQYGERAVRRASAAPRGFAKSTIKALIKPIHDVVYSLERFIVLVSNTEPQASQKTKDISTEFLTNNLLRDFYGSWLPSKKVGATDFICIQGDNSCRIYAVGSKTEVRGIRFGESRPSKIVCDDVEHSQEVENEAIRDKYEDWYKEVISKIGDTKTNIEFIGTVLHRKSLLKSLVNNPKYSSRSYKAINSWAEDTKKWAEWKRIYCDIDDDQRQDKAREYFLSNEESMMKGVDVLWPEKEPYYHLQEEIIETGMRAFMKEKQNSPMSDEEKTFDPEDFWWYEQTTNKKGEEGFLVERTNRFIPLKYLQPLGVIDPSTGKVKPSQNRKTDFTCILTGYKDPISGRVFVHEDYTKRVSPSKYVKQIFELNEIYQYHKFGIETNLYRGLLTDNIRDEQKRQQMNRSKHINIKFVDIVQTENKEKRIYTIEPKVSNGYLVFNKHLSQEFKDQMWEFPKGKNDDCPDALEMLWGLANNKYKAGALNKGIST